MSTKLQDYRRTNQQLTQENKNLTCWVENLCEVFATIGSSWKIITENQQAFYHLLRKKTDQTSKTLINKYISHFKSFEDIAENLGQKITNTGHSDQAARDAKERLTAFVNNYQLFFIEFVETYFKFNEDCSSWLTEQIKEKDLQKMTRNLMSKELENRQKIKQYDQYISSIKQKLPDYETKFQQDLLGGLISQKSKEIENLKELTLKQARRIALMVDYNSTSISEMIEDQSIFECNCGGRYLKYFNKKWQENLSEMVKMEEKKLSVQNEKNNSNHKKIENIEQFQIEKQLLIQRNTHLQAKVQKLKIQNKFSDDLFLNSPIYVHLRSQCKELIDYTSDLVLKLNKSYENINQIQKLRLEQIDELKRKNEKPIKISNNSHNSPFESGFNKTILINFKTQIINAIHQLKKYYGELNSKSQEKEQSLTKTKDLMKSLRRQNEELNKKVGQIQDKYAKSIKNLEFRHDKFNQLESKVLQLIKSIQNEEERNKIFQLWQLMSQYIKTRDKKIKAMEDQIRKKDKQIAQKDKTSEIYNGALEDTEKSYHQARDKLNKFEQFINKTEKQLTQLTQENYKIKIESEKEKNILSLRLKAEIETKSNYEQKVRMIDKVETETQEMIKNSQETQRNYKQFLKKERQEIMSLKLKIKEKELQIQKASQLNEQFNKAINKLSEQKLKSKVEYDKLSLKLKYFEQKSDYDTIKMEMQEYKRKIMCGCGNQRQREVFLKTCPHLFCKKCIQDTTHFRSRKCPICRERFNKTDIIQIIWN